ncbi:amino acid ABC transporter substrate-binding protein [Thermococcus sp. M39]|uniref:ABC transporter substrate-binding protein n=1 Tax=unclassified Thermococcus TaxID=2627626 RepID=UPI001438BA62|nr:MULTISPECIES: ABC transporter substrate-binding protein [unclassified Thermococcus]NJE09157.1 amino acid ABC transporter substrate-binding protein [Thermococcus sp. M39]NJE13076.1 amino acid ABC transporter substrate-binding protein [Thermococcus sp. LS2]
MKKVLAFLVVCLVVLSLGCIGGGEKTATPSSTESTKSAEVQVIKIGLLTDLSGPLSSDGQNVKNCVELAKEEINEYFKEKGLPYEVEILVEDTRTDPKVALEKLQTLKAQDVNVVVGPLSSGEVRNLRSYATSNKIVIISPSTAPPQKIGAMKPEDKKFIFRFVPTDLFQSKAIAAEIEDLGFKGVVIIYRGDAWGKGLHDALVEKIKDKVEIGADVEYPSNPAPTDWSPYIAKLEDGVKQLIDKYGKDKVAVWVAGFDEVATLLTQIPDDSPLLQVKWIGSDGTVGSQKIVEEAKGKAVKVGLLSTQFYSESDEAKKLKEKFKAKFGGEPEQYGLIAYDATWVAALAYAEVLKEKGSYDPDLMVQKIKEVLEKYNSGALGVKPVTGTITLNEWNDRASGDYAIYKVTESGWKMIGIWHSDTNKVEWLEKP